MKENSRHIEYFWEKGNGRDFLNWSNASIESNVEDFPTELFHEYDHQVDEMVSNWIQKGEFRAIMQFLHGTANYDKLPENFKDFYNSLNKVPDWVDFDLIELGAQLCQRSGLMGLLVLRNFALLGGYFFSNLTQPLVVTGSLEKGATLRLHNTLNFWVEVSRSGKSAQAQRIKSSIQIRFVHAASRLKIKEQDLEWDYTKYGVPINNADMIATNIAFTVYFLYGIHKLKISYSEKEEKGIFHLWKYITWLLGVPENTIPNNNKESILFFYKWSKNQEAPNENSIALAKALLEEDTQVNLIKIDWIKNNMGYIHTSVANELIDDQILKLLEIPTVKFKNLIPSLLKLKNEIENKLSSKKQIIIGNKEQWDVLADYKTNSKTR